MQMKNKLLLLLFIMVICIGMSVSVAAGASETQNTMTSSIKANPVLSQLPVQGETGTIGNGFVRRPAVTRSSPAVNPVTDLSGSGSDSGPVRMSSGETYRYLTKWGEFPHRIQSCQGVAVDPSGNLYAVSSNTGSVMKFNSSGGYISSLNSWNESTDSFSTMNGIATDSGGNVYVADDSRIVKLNATGGFQTTFGEELNTTFGSVAVDSSGNVYAADNGGHTIHKYNQTGGYLMGFGSDRVVTPTGVAVDSTGNTYVSDAGGLCVFKFNSTGGYVSQIGTPGLGNGQFSYPSGVAIGSGGSIYVTDTARNDVQKFSSSGTYSAKFGTMGSGHGQFDTPFGVATDSGGNVYVGDMVNNRAQKFSSTGTYKQSFGEPAPGQFIFPTKIARDTDGNIYVSDSEQNRIQKFGPTGTFITAWGSEGTGNGQFNNPEGIATDSTGKVYVVDRENHRIQKFSSTGTFISKWGEYGSDNGQFVFPENIAIDSGGFIYVLDKGNSRVQKFDPTGIYVTQWGSEGFGDGEFKSPTGITVFGGNIYVSDSRQNRTQVFNATTGTYISKWDVERPTGIAADSTGHIFVSDSYNQNIRKYNSTGSIITSFGTGGSGDGQVYSPLGLVVNSAGNVYVVDSDNARIQVFEKAPYLALTGIKPGSAPNTGTCQATITGADISTGVIVNLTNPTISIPGTVLSSNKTSISCSFALAGAPTQVYNLTVRNPDGQNVTLTDAFTVTNATPTITSISPTSGFNASSLSATIVGTAFRNGATVSLTNGSTTLPGTITNRTTTKILCTFPLTGVRPGLYNLTVLNIDSSSATRSNAFTVNPSGTNPTIAGLSPVSGVNTAALPLTITGTNYRAGATVTITNGTTNKTVSGTLTGSTIIKCSLPLAGLPYGLYNVTVRNSDGSNVTMQDSFSITNPTPAITGISPVSGYTSGSSVVTISGSKFVTGAGISLVRGGTSIPGTITSFTTTKIVGTFALTGAASGSYNLTVTNPGGPNATKPFAVISPGTDPTIAGLSPVSGVNTAALPITITGTNYRAGATVTITNGTTNKTVSGTLTGNTTIKCSLPLTGLPYGLYNVTVRNADGSNMTLQDSFSVINPTPAITSISPASGYSPGSSTVTITGSKFVTRAGISLVSGGTSIPGAITSFTSTKIVGTFILTGAAPGSYNLTVTNPGGPNATKPFSIQSPGTDPTIAGLSPVSGVNTAALPITITGTNYRAGATVTITNGTTNKTVSGTLTGNTTIKCSLPLTGLPYGLYNVTVRNSDGSNVTLQDWFSVINPTPVITIISPVSGYTSGSSTVTITGSKFVSGAGISLVSGGTTIPGAITSFTTTKIVGTFVLTGAVPGSYNLTVTNPGGPNATKSFTVISPGTDPTIAGLTPASGVNTAALPITITGTNYRAGATVTITNGTTNKTISGTLTGNTVIKCSLPLTGLPYGLYNVTIRNSDGSNVTRENGFTVSNPVPAITSVTPISGYNTGSVMATIAGTKFTSGASISLVNGSTTITGTVTSLSATKITGTFPITGSLAGKYNITVTNPVDLTGTKLNAFTINAPGTTPVISGINPASGFNNANLPVTISGSNFNKPAVYISQGSLLKLAAATAGKTTTTTAVYVTLPLTGVPGGLYNITVRNSDGVNTTAYDIFYVTDQAWLSSTRKTVTRSPVVLQAGVTKTGTPATSLVIAGPSGRQVIGGGVVVPGVGR